MRRAGVAVAAALALVAIGCGGDDDGESATDLLKRGFATDVDSGVLKVEAEVELDGLAALGGPVRLELGGPFRATGAPTEIPDADWDFSLTAAGQEVDGRVVVTRENLWIEYDGEAYEVGERLWPRTLESLRRQDGGPETLQEAGVDPLDWVEDAEVDGEEEVAGVQTIKVTAGVDLERMLRDFNELVPRAESIPDRTLDQIGEQVDDVELEAWIGDDDIWRRIDVETDFEVPPGERDSTGGLAGGSVGLEIELERPNEPVEIEGLGDGRPISELLRALGIPPQSLFGPGFAVPEAG